MFSRLALDVGLDRNDVKYALNRIQSEGLPFLTITLPKLSRAVLHCIEKGNFHVATCLAGEPLTDFAWKGRFPRFCRGLLISIFDEASGDVVGDHEQVADALNKLRQLCEYAYKLAVPFNDQQLLVAEAKYVETEKSLAQYEPDPKWVETLRGLFTRHFPVLAGLELHELFDLNRPRFTGGSFAVDAREKENDVLYQFPYYAYKSLPDALIGTTTEVYKDYSGFFKPYPSSPTDISIMGWDSATRSQVLFVPKDSRGPRVISKEPLHALRAQMSYFDTVTNLLERATVFGGDVSRINFRDQSVNRRLASDSSVTREYATLDLKDASDRVTWALCEPIFRHAPGMYAVLRKRTTSAEMPSGNVVQLRKLSGMGSGLTFPTMALVIYLSVVATVMRHTGSSYENVARKVYVYGDDLIVPASWLGYAKRGLEASGLLVNTSKTFTMSHFRESCGGDFYYGINVAPVRLTLTFAKLHVFGPHEDNSFKPAILLEGDYPLAKLERHCRELVKAGLSNLSEYYYHLIEQEIGLLPQVSGDSPVMGRYAVDAFPELAYTRPDGSFKTIRVNVPVAKTEEFPHCDVYKRLGQLLAAPASSLTWWQSVQTQLKDRPSARHIGDVVDVPRDCVIAKRRLNAAKLRV